MYIKKIVFFLCLAGSVIFLSCGKYKKKNNSSKELSITNWNVQTFFDVKDDGVEFDEFKTGKYWNESLYKVRLERLAGAIKEIDSDILVMEEIENESVLKDLLNFVKKNWDPKKNYNYSVFAKNETNAFGIGIISRFPLVQMKCHNVESYAEQEAIPDMRPIVEVCAKVGDFDLYIYANHWKSKSGKTDGEKWRILQEKLLCESISKTKKMSDFIICLGDFNKDIEEFNFGKMNLECSIYSEATESYKPYILSSPWEDLKKEAEWGENLLYNYVGTYFYNEKWEKIDSMFLSPNIYFSRFYVNMEDAWYDDKPLRFNLFTGEGYSDHLPITCKITLKK